METKTKNNNAGFWRRLAAFWIDAFVIYSVTKFIIVLLSLIDFRISFGALFIVTGTIYSIIMLSMQRQTIGKMLMQIMVVSKTDEPINLRYILLREIFGKWGITVSMPLILGPMLVGNNWLPTVSDILIMLPVTALCLVYYLLTKQMWYEQLAGLTVRRHSTAKPVKIGFYALMASAVLGIGTASVEYLAKGRVSCRMSAFQNINSTKPYVSFLKEQKTNPVDYVIGLFDRYDVVVLCERDHPEMTQWDFIYDIVRDPRFIAKAGHIFTEYGHAGMQGYLDKFMSADGLNEVEIHGRILHIMRNMPVWPAWTNYNLYNYLKRLYLLNQTLPADKRIRHYFTDSAMSWDEITTISKYQKYEKNCLMNRDERMAKTIINEMDTLSKSASKSPKCLVIMNYRHAMDFTDRVPNVDRVNTYEFLKDSFGNRSANVLINTTLFSIPIASGIWDAAFEKIGNKPLGFDFQGSPFGYTPFDLFPFNNLFLLLNKKGINPMSGHLRYRDVFTGFVFTHPVKDMIWQTMIPGYFDGFEKEYIRRCACLPESRVKENAMMYQYSESHGKIEKYLENSYETKIELFFYSISGFGLIIGFVAYLFRERKNL